MESLDADCDLMGADCVSDVTGTQPAIC